MAVFLVFILLLCCRCERNPCSLSEKTLENIAKLDSSLEVPKFRERMNGWIRGSYSEFPIDSSGNETYRFIKHPPFDNSEVYRIEKREEGYYAIFKEINLNDGSLEYFDEWEISEERWSSITHHLDSKGFWTYFHEDDRKLLDPEIWWLEGYKLKKDKCTFKNYHMVCQYPSSDTKLIDMCEVFMDLKNDTNNNIEIYRSTGDSLQRDLYLRILHKDVDLFGWKKLEGEDTLYYWSKSRIKRDELGIMSFRFEEFQLSRYKITESTLDNFYEDYELSLSYANSPFMFPYSNFINGIVYRDSIKIFAAKDMNTKYFDKLNFERVK